jgi:hypothetical protein
MELTYATIELINQYDEYKSEEGLIQPSEIRRWSGEFMIDTGGDKDGHQRKYKRKTRP